MSLSSPAVTLAFPFFSALRKLFLLPTQGVLLLANYGVDLFSDIYEVATRIFIFATSNMSHFTYDAPVKPPKPSEVSFLHSLWKDLFSKVCLASILSYTYSDTVSRPLISFCF